MVDERLTITGATIGGRELVVASGEMESIVDWGSDEPGARVWRAKIVPAAPFDIEPGEYQLELQLAEGSGFAPSFVPGPCTVSSGGEVILLRTSSSIWEM
jgi:hypothetical protein